MQQSQRLLGMDAAELQSLTEEFAPSSATDASGPVTLSCAAILEAAVDSPRAVDPDFVVCR